MMIETVKVHHPENKRLGWRIINKSEFDPAVHKLWADEEARTEADHEPKKRGRPAKGQE